MLEMKDLILVAQLSSKLFYLLILAVVCFCNSAIAAGSMEIPSYYSFSNESLEISDSIISYRVKLLPKGYLKNINEVKKAIVFVKHDETCCLAFRLTRDKKRNYWRTDIEMPSTIDANKIQYALIIVDKFSNITYRYLVNEYIDLDDIIDLSYYDQYHQQTDVVQGIRIDDDEVIEIDVISDDSEKPTELLINSLYEVNDNIYYRSVSSYARFHIYRKCTELNEQIKFKTVLSTKEHYLKETTIAEQICNNMLNKIKFKLHDNGKSQIKVLALSLLGNSRGEDAIDNYIFVTLLINELDCHLHNNSIECK